MVIIEDLLPQFPWLGPPLPKALNIFWPWLNRPNNPRPLQPSDRAQVVSRHEVVKEPGDLWIDWENELGGGRRAVWEAVRELGEYGFIEEAVTEPYDEVYHYWLLELTNRDWHDLQRLIDPEHPRVPLGVIAQANYYLEPSKGWVTEEELGV